jgi:hypothetical protein
MNNDKDGIQSRRILNPSKIAFLWDTFLGLFFGAESCKFRVKLLYLSFVGFAV